MIKPKPRIRKIRSIEAIKREAMPAIQHLDIPLNSIIVCPFCKQRPGIHITCYDRAVLKAKGFAPC